MAEIRKLGFRLVGLMRLFYFTAGVISLRIITNYLVVWEEQLIVVGLVSGILCTS